MKKKIVFIFVVLSNFVVNAQDANNWMDEFGFAFLDTTLQYAQYDVRYAGKNNFIGRPIAGYSSNRLVMTRQAAMALKMAEKLLHSKGLGLKIFDTYRPQRAVNHFIEWAEDFTDTINRHSYYPEHHKSTLFDLGYISSRSGHTRGSTIDLTLYDLESGEDVDMGGPYDYFGELSHHDYDHISQEQRQNRILFKSIMLRAGFRAYSKEWWHYTLNNEPYPDKYFDFVVRSE